MLLKNQNVVADSAAPALSSFVAEKLSLDK
jgi:hypothetical protein